MRKGREVHIGGRMEAGILIILLITPVLGSPHQPFNWTIGRWEDQTVIGINVTAGAPTFRAALCQLAPIEPCLNLKGYYLCPASNPGKGYCNYPNEYYCASWDCVTLAAAWHPGRSDPFLKTQWGPEGCTPPRYDSLGGIISPGNCAHIILTILQPDDFGWITGRTWGVRYWEPGKDRGGLIWIRKDVVREAAAIGPNVVLTNQLNITIKNESSKLENVPTTSIKDDSL